MALTAVRHDLFPTSDHTSCKLFHNDFHSTFTGGDTFMPNHRYLHLGPTSEAEITHS